MTFPTPSLRDKTAAVLSLILIICLGTNSSAQRAGSHSSGQAVLLSSQRDSRGFGSSVPDGG